MIEWVNSQGVKRFNCLKRWQHISHQWMQQSCTMCHTSPLYLLLSYRKQIHISPLSIAPTTTIGREDIWSLGIWKDVFPFHSESFSMARHYSLSCMFLREACGWYSRRQGEEFPPLPQGNQNPLPFCKKVTGLQDHVFPSGHPSKYWNGSKLLNFSDQTSAGVFNMIWQ